MKSVLSFSFVRRILSLGLLVLALALQACGTPPIEIALQLLRAKGATFEVPKALKVVVRDIDASAPEVFGPFELDRSNRTRLAADLAPGARFFLDVSACSNVDECTDVTRLARGCTGIEQVTDVSSLSMTLFLSDAESAAAAMCPPDF